MGDKQCADGSHMWWEYYAWDGSPMGRKCEKCGAEGPACEHSWQDNRPDSIVRAKRVCTKCGTWSRV